MKKHLAIFSKQAVEQIFAGKQTIETRFSIHRIAPFGQVSAGDIVYIKPTGKEICGQFVVKKVISIEGMEAKDWDLVKSFGNDINLGKQISRFATIIFIDRLERFIVPPIKIAKKDQRGWVVLEHI